MSQTKLWTATEIMRGARLVADIRKPWAAPKLADEGRAFDPRNFEIGAWITVRSPYGADGEGQVWSQTDRAGEVFVVLDRTQTAVRVCTRAKHGHACDHAWHLAAHGVRVAA